MAKSSGGTRGSSSGNPRGMTNNAISQANEVINRSGSTGILPREDFEEAEDILSSQISELADANTNLWLAMAENPDNQEYYESQVAENDKLMEELEGELTNLRLRQRGRIVNR